MSLAARGARNLDSGIQSILDERELAQVRWQARQVYLKGIAVGAVMTLLFLVIGR